MARISRSGRRYWILLGLAATFVATPGQAAAPAWMVEELRERYLRSYIEVRGVPVAGRVFGQDAVLILGANGIPANPLRVTQLMAKSPRFHVGDFAPVEVSEDGRLAARPASLTLAKGTRLVVLDLKVNADRVRFSMGTWKRHREESTARAR